MVFKCNWDPVSESLQGFMKPHCEQIPSRSSQPARSHMTHLYVPPHTVCSADLFSFLHTSLEWAPVYQYWKAASAWNESSIRVTSLAFCYLGLNPEWQFLSLNCKWSTPLDSNLFVFWSGHSSWMCFLGRYFWPLAPFITGLRVMGGPD